MSGQHDLFVARPFRFHPREAFGTRQPDSEPPDTAERSTLAAQVAAFFKCRPNQWVDGRELMTFAGSYGWRTRISDIRRSPYNMRIDNRQRREGRSTVSEYMFVPVAADADLGGAA